MKALTRSHRLVCVPCVLHVVSATDGDREAIQQRFLLFLGFTVYCYSRNGKADLHRRMPKTSGIYRKSLV